MPITDAVLNTTLPAVIDPNTCRDHGSAKRIWTLGGTPSRGEDRAQAKYLSAKFQTIPVSKGT